MVRLVNGLSHIIFSFDSTGIPLTKAVNMNSNSIISLTDLTASGNVSSGTTTTNTLTTVGVVLNVNGDPVLFSGNHDSLSRYILMVCSLVVNGYILIANIAYISFLAPL